MTLTREQIEAIKKDLAPDAMTTVALCEMALSTTALVEALKRFVENSPCQNGCSPDDMTCDTSFAKHALSKFEKDAG